MAMMLYKDQYIKVGDISTRYWSVGEKGKTIILIHGFGTSVEIWQHNISVLSKDYKVVAFDIPGFGRSDKIQHPDFFTFIPRFVSDFMDALNIGKASLMGISLGGAISLKFAVQYPNKIDKLILVDSGGLGTDLPFSMCVVSLPIVGELLTRPSRKMTYEFLKPLVFDPKILNEEIIDFYYELSSLPGAQKSLLCILRSFCNIFGPYKDMIHQIKSSLYQISAPTLIIWGKYDASFPLSHAYYAKEKIPNSKLHIIDQSGHLPNFEKPEEFNQIVLNFLND
jgi:4,5:9,10-diseco-3-hydroxy-5,9,17-trioxoandrosta-1(10),2-diene-4-oate hydrolase